MRLELRGLNPDGDIDLFREAYAWRDKKNKRRMGFEEFARTDAQQARVGLFNGEFIALYGVTEYAPAHYDMHFTSKRGAPRQYLVAGGIRITNWLIENGACEVSALIMARNRPLREFLEACGYSFVSETVFEEQDKMVRYLKYAAL